MKADRVPSGVPGLDELIGGGFPKGTVCLLSGGPGSGKTTFSLQFVCNGIKQHKEPGVYVTLSETPDDIRRNAASFGWDLKPLEGIKKLAIIDARPVRFFADKREGKIGEAETFSSWLWGIIRDNAIRVTAKRIVVDSLSVLSSQFPNEFIERQSVIELVQKLQTLPECTSFLLFEQIKMERTMEEFLTHGVIILHYVPVKNGMMRAIQVLKMRRTEHSENFHPFIIDAKGVTIKPKETSTFF